MPQMAPLPWISLLMLTICTLLFISTIIFFSFKQNKNKITKMQKTSFLIKW
uniref:ATP synthase F0 subunit 8 n=1 Tax=Cacopsylla jukyungi TaxID=2593406 RepID=UPI0022FD8EC7|nr:ATP synthase F0 subunit 8 [Cacopsylla jukyungi]WAL33202.1 ATP synthase F0 subunit 8 [Cacopsylla jukyungi]